ncbi:agamous-like MADS-box protein AGL80 [Impatiens glandulifera]|uniref:agamous-like MADS-box protein AGL80 n=1 Tax=Impatiens glandulifera TaxID=253017 RepID=UPI001FB0FCD2|nr:agamous-like MADS-box protein AGL80 [Impatiens glandulifera]
MTKSSGIRKKVKLSYILNRTVRKTTFKKRKVCIVKKLDELTTLCGVEGCVIIYSEFDSQPVVWPSINEVRRLITKFLNFPKIDQGKRKVNQETFTRQRIEKVEEKLKRLQRENRLKEITYIMFQSMISPQSALSNLNVEGFEYLASVASQNLMEVEKLMEIRRRDSSFNPPPQFNASGSGVGGRQHLVVSQDVHHGRFGSSMEPNMITYSPLPPFMEFLTPNMGFEPHPMNFQPTNMMFEPINVDYQYANMGFQPLPNMDFQPAIEFQPLLTDFPQNDLPDMDPNMGMPDPSDLPPFP